MIEWNKVTWYSRWGAVILFLVVVPVLSFYIGTEYEALRQTFSTTTSPKDIVQNIDTGDDDVETALTLKEAEDILYSYSKSMDLEKLSQPGANSFYCVATDVEENNATGYAFRCSVLVPDGHRVTIGVYTVDRYTGKVE